MSQAARVAAVVCCSSVLIGGCSDPRRYAVGDSGTVVDGSAGSDRGVGHAADCALLDARGDPGTHCANNYECLQHEYCHLEGVCVVSGAGVARCKPRPDSCSTIAAPVCGCDGKTYSNECTAHAAGINVAHAGKCAGECGTLLYLPACPSGQVCDFTSCGAAVGSCVEQPVACPPLIEIDPVCGCDGQTYDSDCTRLLAGVARKHQGDCATGAVTLTSDRTSYDAGDPIELTLTNGTAESIFLPGCSIYSYARRESGVWVDKGAQVYCAWEGLAREVSSGERGEDHPSLGGGTWRGEVTYGVGCTPNQPLSQAGCAAMRTVQSTPFMVLPTKEECSALMDQYNDALVQAKQCNHAVNTPQCQVLVWRRIDHRCPFCATYVVTDDALLDLQQIWIDTRCDLRDDALCPPTPCTNPVDAGCSQDNVCVDIGGWPRLRRPRSASRRPPDERPASLRTPQQSPWRSDLHNTQINESEHCRSCSHR